MTSSCHRRLRAGALAAALFLAGCGDEDTGGGPAGGFDDRTPESDNSDDFDDRAETTTSVDLGGTRVEGTDTEAGTPSGGIGNVEGEGDVNDLGEEPDE